MIWPEGPNHAVSQTEAGMLDVASWRVMATGSRGVRHHRGICVEVPAQSTAWPLRVGHNLAESAETEHDLAESAGSCRSGRGVNDNAAGGRINGCKHNLAVSNLKHNLAGAAKSCFKLLTAKLCLQPRPRRLVALLSVPPPPNQRAGRRCRPRVLPFLLLQA